MFIRKLFRKYPETTLILLALVFLGVIFGGFSWGIGDVVGEVNHALNASIGGNNEVGFNLQGAQTLDLRGLVKTAP